MATSAPRRGPTPASLEFVRSLDDPPLVRARVAKALKVDDVVVQEGRRVDQLDRHRQLAGGVAEAAADPRGQRDAHRPQVLAVEVEQVVRRLLDLAAAAGQLGELLAEAAQVGGDEVGQLGELATDVAVAEPAGQHAEPGDQILVRRSALTCLVPSDRHGASPFLCFKNT